MPTFLLTAVGLAAWAAVALFVSQGDTTATYLFLSPFIWVGLALYGLKITFDRHHKNGVELLAMIFFKTVIFASGFTLSAEFLEKPLGIVLGIVCLVLTTLALFYIGAKPGTSITELFGSENRSDESPARGLALIQQCPELIVKANLQGCFVATVLSIADVGSKVERGEVIAKLRAEPPDGGMDLEVKTHAERSGVVTAVHFKVGDRIWDEVEMLRIKAC